MAKIFVTASLGTNTGRTSGDIMMGRIKAFFPTRGKIFTEAELADSDSLKAALQAAILLSREDPNKIFIVDGLREIDDNTGEPQKFTLADGYEENGSDALPKYTGRTTKGVAEQQALVTFNGWQDPGFILDDQGVFWYKGTADGGGKGFSIANWYANPPRPGGTGAARTNTLSVVFGSADEFKSNVGALKVDFTAAELQNLVDMSIKEVAPIAGDVVTVSVFNKFAGTSLYAKLKAALSQTGAWEFVNLTTGAVVAASAVAANDNTPDKNGGFGAFAVTMTAGSPAGKYKIRTKNPSVLAGLATPLVGYEGVETKFTKAA